MRIKKEMALELFGRTNRGRILIANLMVLSQLLCACSGGSSAHNSPQPDPVSAPTPVRPPNPQSGSDGDLTVQNQNQNQNQNPNESRGEGPSSISTPVAVVSPSTPAGPVGSTVADVPDLNADNVQWSLQNSLVATYDIDADLPPEFSQAANEIAIDALACGLTPRATPSCLPWSEITNRTAAPTIFRGEEGKWTAFTEVDNKDVGGHGGRFVFAATFANPDSVATSAPFYRLERVEILRVMKPRWNVPPAEYYADADNFVHLSTLHAATPTVSAALAQSRIHAPLDVRQLYFSLRYLTRAQSSESNGENGGGRPPGVNEEKLLAAIAKSLPVVYRSADTKHSEALLQLSAFGLADGYKREATVHLAKGLWSLLRANRLPTPTDSLAQTVAVILFSGDPGRDELRPYVFAAFANSNPRVRQLALATLSNVKTSASENEALLAAIEAEKNRGEWAEFSERLLAIQEPGLASPDEQARIKAIRILGRLESPLAQDRLVDVFASSPRGRTQDEAFSQIRGGSLKERSVEVLGKMTSRPRGSTREMAVRLLGTNDGERATLVLIPFLADRDEQVRARALKGLTESRSLDRSCVQPLKQLALEKGAKNPALRLAVIKALRHIRGDESLDALLTLLGQETDPSLRKTIGTAMDAVR